MNTAVARRTDPDTSHAAAKVVNVNKLQMVILEQLNEYSQIGLTITEIATSVDKPRDSLSPRMKFLVECELVIDSGNRRAPSHFGLEEKYRNAKSNGSNPPRRVEQIVWLITRAGMEFVRHTKQQKLLPNVT